MRVEHLVTNITLPNGVDTCKSADVSFVSIAQHIYEFRRDDRNHKPGVINL